MSYSNNDNSYENKLDEYRMGYHENEDDVNEVKETCELCGQPIGIDEEMYVNFKYDVVLCESCYSTFYKSESVSWM